MIPDARRRGKRLHHKVPRPKNRGTIDLCLSMYSFMGRVPWALPGAMLSQAFGLKKVELFPYFWRVVLRKPDPD